MRCFSRRKIRPPSAANAFYHSILGDSIKIGRLANFVARFLCWLEIFGET
jgi:hypothetical protein